MCIVVKFDEDVICFFFWVLLCLDFVKYMFNKKIFLNFYEKSWKKNDIFEDLVLRFFFFVVVREKFVFSYYIRFLVIFYLIYVCF